MYRFLYKISFRFLVASLSLAVFTSFVNIALTFDRVFSGIILLYHFDNLMYFSSSFTYFSVFGLREYVFRLSLTSFVSMSVNICLNILNEYGLLSSKLTFTFDTSSRLQIVLPFLNTILYTVLPVSFDMAYSSNVWWTL